MLNDAQQKAVNMIDGQLLMIACPGSGKTTTMLHRIVNMVRKGISPYNIIMMTFTKAAANEMKERYLKMEGAKEGVIFCTIHSLCFNIINETGEEHQLITEHDTKDYFFEKLKYNSRIADLISFISDLVLDISRKKTSLGKETLIKCTNDIKFFNTLYQDYENYKSERNLIDYDDMIILAYDILIQNPTILKKYQERFKYIQIDEFQDTDEIQKNVIYKIVGENGNLAVVGDEDQSIYAFRGANPSIMLNFKKDYPNAKIINMGINYRSSIDIVNKAENLIKENTQRFQKEFTAFKSSKGEVKCLSFINRAEEIGNITNIIEKMIKNGTDPNEIAILYRNNVQAEDFAYEFLSRGIDFKVAGSMPNKYEHFIWNDIMLFKKVSQGEGSRFDVERILNKPKRYLKFPDYKEFPDIDAFGKFKISYLNEEHFRMKVYEDAYLLPRNEFWKVKSKLNSISNFFILLNKLATIENPVTFMKVLWSSAYEKYLIEYSDFRQVEYDTFKDKYAQYIEEAEKYGPTWKDFENYISKYKATIEKNKNSKQGVALSTMHKAKGLEWDNVFVVDCVEGICPAVSNKGLVDIEEERRIFYVAATRARNKLFLANYNFNGYKLVKESSFLKHFK